MKRCGEVLVLKGDQEAVPLLTGVGEGLISQVESNGRGTEGTVDTPIKFKFD